MTKIRDRFQKTDPEKDIIGIVIAMVFLKRSVRIAETVYVGKYRKEICREVLVLGVTSNPEPVPSSGSCVAADGDDVARALRRRFDADSLFHAQALHWTHMMTKMKQAYRYNILCGYDLFLAFAGALSGLTAAKVVALVKTLGDMVVVVVVTQGYTRETRASGDGVRHAKMEHPAGSYNHHIPVWLVIN